ncbi:Patellin-6 [Castilleja foliolosa]|uniref:Patellin-6 n=1 Tax=Castilleja foliolosa TaxID=1961234 RepID=A0ABD3CEE5_9LAMI
MSSWAMQSLLMQRLNGVVAVITSNILTVLYGRIFGDDEKLKRFLRWRVQVLERGIKLLDFKPGGVNSIIQVTDLKVMPRSELREASKHILSLFQDKWLLQSL